MTSYIRADVRREVYDRAGGRCEYCLIHERDTFLGCQVDHIVSEKHGGPNDASNLALACACCNRAKGSDVGSLSEATGDFVRFFNPRIDDWTAHFSLNEDLFAPLSVIGEATIRILRLNSAERVLERRALRAVGKYHSAE